MPRCHIAVFVRRAGATSRCSCAPPVPHRGVRAQGISQNTTWQGVSERPGFLSTESLYGETLRGARGAALVGRPPARSRRGIPLHSPLDGLPDPAGLYARAREGRCP